MGWWNKKNSQKKAVQTRGWFGDEKNHREICHASIIERPSPRSELRENRKRRFENTGRYIYR